MTSNFAKDAIEEAYEMALKKIDKERLFGEKVDLDNSKHVAVAMYFLGQQDARKISSSYLEAIERLGI